MRDASAHAGAPPDTLDLMSHAESATALSVEATFGLLLSDDTQSWRWLCHETIAQATAFLTPAYARSADGVMLATVAVLQQGQDPQESAYRSVDGCDWAPPTGLRDLVVTDIAFDPTDPAVVLAVTGGVTVGVLNGIHRSTDGGATFTPTSSGELDSRIFNSVAISAASGDSGTTAWATAAWFGPLGAWVYRSTDGGQTWEEHPQTLMDGDDLQVQIVIGEAHQTDPLVAWIIANGSLEDRVLRTDDGGETFSEIFRSEGDIQDVLHEPDGTVWIATLGGGLHRAPDGSTFVPVADAPEVNAMQRDDRGVHLALAGGLTEDVVVRTQDGSSFETVMVWDDLVGPLECPDESDSGVFCTPSWNAVQLALGRFGNDDDATDDDDSAGGGEGCCNEGASIASADEGSLLALALLACLRRRRDPPG